MAETAILRSCAINRNGALGKSSQAQLSGPLPMVQVTMTGNGPQLPGGQAAAMTPKDAKRSTSSGLPMVQVTMTGNGPQLQGGQTRATAAMPQKDARRPASSGLPMVQVNMTTGGPQVEKGAAVAPSQSNQPRTVARAQVPQVPQAPQASELLTADQLLLCRHLSDKYLGELRADAGEAQVGDSAADNIKLAEATIFGIDAAMIALTTAEAAAIIAREEIAAAPPPSAPPLRVVVGSRSVQANASVAPRRVARPAAPLPIIDVRPQSPPEPENGDVQG